MKLGTARRSLDLRDDFWRVAGVLAALLLLNAGFYLFFNLPRLRDLDSLKSGGDAAGQALAGSTTRCQTMRDLVARYDEETGHLDDFYANRLGTQASRMTSIQKEIRSIASEFRIDPEAIDYSPEEVEGTDLIRFQISIPLVGGYPNLRNFINRIESSDHLLIVDSVELTGAREGGAMLSLTIRISTYFRSPEKDIRRAAQPAT
jgi:Tfp pilus assembly protein PilO